MNTWKTNEDGIVWTGTTDVSKKEFLNMLRKGVELVKFNSPQETKINNKRDFRVSRISSEDTTRGCGKVYYFKKGENHYICGHIGLCPKCKVGK